LPSFNEQKFARMQEKREELYGATMAISEKRQRARQALQATQGAEIGFRNKSPRKELPADLRAALLEAEEEYFALDEQYKKIQQRWQEYASCVDRCAEFLRSRGVKTDNPPSIFVKGDA